MDNTIAHAPEHPLDVAAREIGGRGLMASKLQVTVAAIGNWKSRGVPEEQCPAIERLAQGRSTCEQLRPDRRWVRWPDADWPHPDGRPLLDLASEGVAASI